MLSIFSHFYLTFICSLMECLFIFYLLESKLNLIEKNFNYYYYFRLGGNFQLSNSLTKLSPLPPSL